MRPSNEAKGKDRLVSRAIKPKYGSALVSSTAQNAEPIMSSEACGRLQAFFRSRTDAGAHPADQSDAEQDTCATGGQLRTVDIDGIRLCQPCEKLRDPGRDAIVHRK